MNSYQMMECLGDERCGLYFLAGLDTKNISEDTSVLTVHAVDGAIGESHEFYIKSTFAAFHPNVEVRIRNHSTDELYRPNSLEQFAQMFAHDRIVADPTGSFDRVSRLLALSSQLRSELGSSVSQVLWQADTSTLIAVSTEKSAVESSDAGTSFEALQARLRAFVSDRSCADLKKTIKSVRLTSGIPAGRYTPVDAMPEPAPKPPVASRIRRSSGLFARLSALAAMIGLGTMTVANAATSPTVDEPAFLPGITGLVGLTTLGENSYGLRNRFQAVGGLRLYFGESGVRMASVVSSVPTVVDESRLAALGNGKAAPVSKPTWPEPTRVAYG